MLTMLFVISIVLSGNSALAAQRETFKPKDTNSANNNANAIFNEIGSANTNINGNGNAVIHSNANNIGNGNSNVNNSNNIVTSNMKTQKTPTTLSTSTSTSSSSIATTINLHTTSSSSSSHKTSSFNRNSIELQDTSQNGPYFDKGASKNVTALLGKTAYLNCRVKNLGNKTMLLQVSWVRHRDIHLLTVGRYTYTSDQRFRAIHQPQTEDWILQIKYPQHRDSGIYECQVSTTPHMSHNILLTVVEPLTKIVGAPDLYIESGSTINLTCIILNSPEPPAYIFWNHNSAIINYDSLRGGVSVVTNKGETTTSFLLIKSARPSDSGLYQCNPSNSKPKSVTVHVLNGVSHSISREVPSSNAARSTGTSSNVSKSLHLSVPVNVLVYFSICQALSKTASRTVWSTICAHVIKTCQQLLEFLLAIPLAKFVREILHAGIKNYAKNQKQFAAETTVTLNSNTSRNNKSNASCCFCIQLRENYHMTHTAEVLKYVTTITTGTGTLRKRILKSTCKRQTLSEPSSSPLFTKVSTATLSAAYTFFCTINLWCFLLSFYSKGFFVLYQNNSSTLKRTEISSGSLFI